MTNEAVLKLRLDTPYDWIVENTRGVEKGTLMKISGVGIAAPTVTAGSAEVWAGVARREKIASDGRTRLSLFRRGIFDMVACPVGATIPEGSWVCSSGVNLIRTCTAAELATGAGIGTAREEIVQAGTGEIILGGI